MPYTENYRTEPVNGFPGMISDMSLATILSRTVAGSAIAFGSLVKAGSADHTVEAAEASDDPLGIAVRLQGVVGTSSDAYPVGETAAIIVSGPVWVVAGGTVNNDEGPVFYVAATGRYAHTGDVEIPGARFESSGAAGDLVRLRLGLPTVIPASP